MPHPGTLLSEPCTVHQRIASGGMGEVWRGSDPVLSRTVAVKLLLPSLVSDAEFITRFRTEARTMANLRHPGIVQVYDYGADALVDDLTRDYLVMEYVEGPSLSAKIAAVMFWEVGTGNAKRTGRCVNSMGVGKTGVCHKNYTEGLTGKAKICIQDSDTKELWGCTKLFPFTTGT